MKTSIEIGNYHFIAFGFNLHNCELGIQGDLTFLSKEIPAKLLINKQVFRPCRPLGWSLFIALFQCDVHKVQTS